MAYNHAAQYRCAIIRGKAKEDLDNLLPAYAHIIDELTPCPIEVFQASFNENLHRILPEAEEKTLDNHRTEIAGKLFGMYISDGENIYVSERTQKYLEDEDQPAFFKDICFKFQFPNGLDKSDNLAEKVENNIKVKPFCLIIKLLQEAQNANMALNKREVAYYAMNNLQVLQGRAGMAEIVAQIRDDRQHGIERRVDNPGKAESFNTQHIREQLNYLELANLIRIKSENIFLNKAEQGTLNIFAAEAYNLGFDAYSYDISSLEGRKEFYSEWQTYYSTIATELVETSATSVEALQFDVDETGMEVSGSSGIDTTELGDDGEKLVFQYEKKRVAEYDQRLTNKIHLLGKTKGLGYDIQSIFARESNDPEFVKYIEVKATKRVTTPPMDGSKWLDTINMTRNEWVAAMQHGSSYEIYRVYFTQDGPSIYIIRNPNDKNENEKLRSLPTHYRVDFGGEAIDKVVTI